MAKVERFEDLICWQEARKLVKIVYAGSNEGKMSKDFGMRDQLRRAALSTMNNIAEGFGRKSDMEFVRFLEYTSSSAIEVKSMTYAALDLNYWTSEEAEKVTEAAEKVKALSLGLIKYLRTKLQDNT